MAEVRNKRSCLDASGTGCTMCCFTHSVRQPLRKPEFQWCTHCTIARGCQVHLSGKPAACDGWLCAWREGLGEEDERPDKTHVVPEWKYTLQGKTLVLMGTTPEALHSEYAQRITKLHATQRIPMLHVHSDGSKQLVFERGIIVDSDIARQAKKEGVEIVFVDTA